MPCSVLIRTKCTSIVGLEIGGANLKRVNNPNQWLQILLIWGPRFDLLNLSRQASLESSSIPVKNPLLRGSKGYCLFKALYRKQCISVPVADCRRCSQQAPILRGANVCF